MNAFKLNWSFSIWSVCAQLQSERRRCIIITKCSIERNNDRVGEVATKCKHHLAEGQHVTPRFLVLGLGHSFQTRNRPSIRENNELDAQHGQIKIVNHHFRLLRFSPVLSTSIRKSPEITTLLLLLPPPPLRLSEQGGWELQLSGGFWGFGPLKHQEAEVLREELKAATASLHAENRNLETMWTKSCFFSLSLPPPLSLRHGCHFQFTMTKATRKKKEQRFCLRGRTRGYIKCC